MEFKKSIIIILLFLALITIPISFASDLDTTVDSNPLSDNNLLINQDVEENILEDNINSDSDLKNDLKNGLKNDLYDEFIESASEIDDGSLYDISSKNKSSSSNLASDVTVLPDLDTGFSQIKIVCSDDNTVFVNSSYTGEEMDGTQSKPFKSISDGFNQLSRDFNKNNIFIAEGSYIFSRGKDIYKSINIIGENPQNTIISGLNESNIFRISTSNIVVNIINLTLTDGLNSQGGAIYVSKSGLNIINTILSNNRAPDNGEGGAIYNNAGFIKIYNSTFLNNSVYNITGTSNSYGGAIYNNLGELSVFNSKFINNSLQGYRSSGGAIYNFNGFLTLFNSSILNTTLNPELHSLGGAICIWNGRNSFIINSTISGTVIKPNNNAGYTFGSAIANKGVLLEIINSTISNNFVNASSLENSTVYNMNGIYHCVNSTFKNNTIKNASSNLLLCLEDQLIISDLFNADLGNLPSSYDLREEGFVTSVKNQSPGGDCWAFAIYSALESYLLKNENITYDFSENNMKNSMYVNGVNGTDWNGGGNHILAFAYLLRGSGPVNESLDPFDAYSTSSPEDLAIEKYVTGFKYIPLRLNYLDNDQIKYALLQYGALYTSIYSNMLRSNGTGYSNLSNINQHAVAIVGWDDNYSRLNFSVAPPGDGAWIIKNSWGEYNGQKGYYYVSYYDATFPGVTDQFAAIAISSVENLSEYKSIYQYDPIGNTYESVGYNSNTAWLANQFTAESNNPLKAFGLYTFGSSSYIVNVTVNGVSKLVQSGNLVGAGYHTVKLNKLINLLKGDIFKITVKLTTPDSLFPIAIESKRTDFSSKASAKLNQSFVSPDGINWIDIAGTPLVYKFYEDLSRLRLQNANVCLKAYVAYNGTLSVESKSNSSIYYHDDIIEISLSIINEKVSVNDFNVSINFDNAILVKSAECSKGSFNYNSKVWHLDSLNLGDSLTLKLQLNMSNFKKDFNVTFGFSPSGIIPSNISSSLRLNFEYGGLTSFVQVKNVSAVAKTEKEVSIKLTDNKSNPIANKTVVISLLSSNQGNNFVFTNVSNRTDKNGVVKLVLNLPAGYFKFLASFKGDNKYDASNMTFNVSVSKKASPKISLERKTLYVDENLKITLKDNKGKIIANKTLKISISHNKGGKYSTPLMTESDGTVELSGLYSGTYSINITFENDDEYNDSKLSDSFSVIKRESRIICSNMTTTAVDVKTDGRIGEYFKWTLVDNKGNPIANVPMQIGFNGKVYDRVTDDNGVSKLHINLGYKGDYTFAICFLSDDVYSGSFAVAKITVNTQTGSLTVPNKLYKVNAKSKTLVATFKSANGNAVQGKKVKFIVNGKTYSATTDSKGIASVQVSLNKKGIYNFTVKYGGESTYAPMSKTAKLVIIN